jgi:ribose-phosphate pyrophosphokinase
MREKINIYSLNLDRTFYPTILPEIDHTLIKFSGGESHIKLNMETDFSQVDKVVITNRFADGNDIMEALIAKDALQRRGVTDIELIIPYIPYARQDRECADGESFTLKVFTNIINSANFSRVRVLDAHSDVAPALLNNCVNIPNHDYVKLAYHFIGEKDVVLVSPDSGANKKCNKLFETVKVFTDLVKCDKVRNVHNGNLKGFEVFTNDLEGRTCMIVDDICDGGRTFVGIAEELKKKNAGDLYLFVTHGIFSYGTEELKKHFKKVFCTNSFKDIDDELIVQLYININY